MTVEDQYASDFLAGGRDLRWRALPRPVLALVVARAANRLGAFSISFLAVLLVADRGATLGQTGAVVAAFGAATIPSRLLGGVLADRIGPVPTIVSGLVGCGVTQLAIAAAPTLLAAAVAAIALGLVYEIYEPSSQALLADLTSDRQRPVAYGLYGAALAVAGAVAGLVAVVVGGWDLRLLLVVDAATCLVAAGLVATTVRPVAAPVPRNGAEAGLRSAAADVRLLLMTAAGTLFALVYMSLVVALPLTFAERGLAPERAGILLSVSAIAVLAGQPLLRWPRLADPFRAMTAGHLLLAVGVLGIGLATTLTGFVTATVVWSLGDVLLLGQYWSVVSRLAPAGARASYLAVFGLSWGAATLVAPLLVTQMLEHAGPTALWSALAGVAGILAVLQPGLARATGLTLLRRSPGAASPSVLE